jgi:hypothetical protein
MIDNGKQNEFGVISILAGSKEAQNRSERLLIVPVASDARPAFSVDFVPGKQEEGELVLS